MRQLTAIAVALGLMLAASAPVFAGNTGHGTTTEFAAATKKKVDCKKTPSAKECKKTSIRKTTVKVAAKKIDCRDPKNKNNAVCKKK